MSEDEWKEPEEPYAYRIWNSEDVNGHRYTAYLSEGSKDRWQLPLPRRDFEQLWAAICQKHPEMAELFGSSQNFIRQIVGSVMQHMIDEVDPMEVPQELQMVLVSRLAQAHIENRERIRHMDSVLKDPAQPELVRIMAGDTLLAVDEDVLRMELRIPEGLSPHALIQTYQDDLRHDT